MRIRSTKPEFWRSARIASVGWDARLVLKGLESYVDDNGVGKDDLALIVGDVFPRDMLANPRDTLARVSEALTDLSEAGLLHRYEVDGTGLLYLSFWEEFQRIDKAGKGRLPRPDGTMEYGASKIRESVASPRETVAPGTGEQGNRGTGARAELLPSPATPSRTSEPAAFSEFWDVYPRKVGKDAAVKAWAKAARRATTAAIVTGARRFATDPNLPEKQFIPHPATWLNDGRWDDEPLPHRPANGGRSLDPQADLLRAEMERAILADQQRDNRLEIGA